MICMMYVIAVSCQESEGEAPYREECMRQSALDVRASDMCELSLTTVCMNIVTLSPLVFARSLRAK